MVKSSMQNPGPGWKAGHQKGTERPLYLHDVFFVHSGGLCVRGAYENRKR